MKVIIDLDSEDLETLLCLNGRQVAADDCDRFDIDLECTIRAILRTAVNGELPLWAELPGAQEKRGATESQAVRLVKPSLPSAGVPP